MMNGDSTAPPATPPVERGPRPAAEGEDWWHRVPHVNNLIRVPDWIALHPLLAHFVAEAVGTFLFTLVYALVGTNNTTTDPDRNITALPIGFMLMCLVFTFGYISGGHFNPAISLAVLATNLEHKRKLLAYVVCQCGGALGAGFVAMTIQGNRDLVVPRVLDNAGEYLRKAVFAEILFTFALVTVVLHVLHSRQKNNFFYGFAIGMVALAGTGCVGGVSGGAFNPAVATGLQGSACLVGRCSALLHVWLYWVAPTAGGAVAVLLFKLMSTGTLSFPNPV